MSPPRLGLRENLPQFSLLVLLNAFVGGMVGLERTVLPLLGEQEFGLTSKTAITSFIVSFGVTKALINLVAARLSDVVILTSDNPRSEPPEAILEEIQRGIPAARAQDTLVIPDRRDAIAKALEMGREGVVVVIAGKGHETYQVLRDRTQPFDDRQVARDVLARLAGAGGKR